MTCLHLDNLVHPLWKEQSWDPKEIDCSKKCDVAHGDGVVQFYETQAHAKRLCGIGTRGEKPDEVRLVSLSGVLSI